MKHFKILETSSVFPDVLIRRDRNENGDEYVEISAIGVIDDIEDMYAIEKVLFEDNLSAISYIKHFSVEAAEDFCKRNKILLTTY